jgi:uncharacterized protein (TIGR03437 family)
MRLTYGISALLLASYLSTGLAVAQSSPAINQGGIVNGATFQAGEPVAPGSLISIFGSDLASGLAGADSIPLSTSLGNATVTFTATTGTFNAPLLFVDPNQMNVQVPWEVLGPGATSDNVTVTVTMNGVVSQAATVNVGSVSPGIFVFNGMGLVANLDNTFAWPAGSVKGLTTHPAQLGDTVVMYTTGLGPVDSPIADGANSTDKLRRTTTTPVVLFGGVQGNVTFSGLSPDYVGVYQLNVQIPATATPGNSVPVQIQIGGITTPATAATMAISQ